MPVHTLILVIVTIVLHKVLQMMVSMLVILMILTGLTGVCSLVTPQQVPTFVPLRLHVDLHSIRSPVVN